MMQVERAGDAAEIHALHGQLARLRADGGIIAAWRRLRRGAGAAHPAPDALTASARQSSFGLIARVRARWAWVHGAKIYHIH
jgi:hypothetical protein